MQRSAQKWAQRVLSSEARHSSARPKLLYVPNKMKEEIMALHEEDPKRWNVTTLSSRFSAERANVEAVLRLFRLRQMRRREVKTRSEEDRVRIERAEERSMEAWKLLGEGVYRGRAIARASVSGGEGLGEDGDGEGESESESEGAGAEDTVEDAVQAGGGEEKKEVVKSAWAEFLEKEIDRAEVDVSRRTTYAFVEIGEGGDDIRRAVWVREGESGRLRLAEEEERRLLMNEVRARDSQAWKR